MTGLLDVRGRNGGAKGDIQEPLSVEGKEIEPSPYRARTFIRGLFVNESTGPSVRGTALSSLVAGTQKAPRPKIVARAAVPAGQQQEH